MKKLLTVAAVAMAFATYTAQAGPLATNLTLDGGSGLFGFPPTQFGGEDKLQDDSLSKLIDVGTPGLSAGDTIWGILTLSEINASGSVSKSIGVNEQIAFLYSGTLAVGPNGTLSVVPTGAGVNSLTSLCGAACAGAGLTPNSIVVALNTTQGVNPLVNPQNDPLNWDALGANGVTANFNGAGSNDPWSWALTAGLESAGDFFQFQGSPILGALSRAALTITSSDIAGAFLDVDVLDFGAAVHVGSLTLDVGRTDIASAAEQARGWSLRDQSTLYVNATQAVPEPGSVVLMGLGLLSLGIVLRRRNGR